MLLQHKNAVIYGAGGAVGSAVARRFAQEGARVFLTGRTLAKVEAVAQAIVAAGGRADVAQVDALDEQAIEQHLAGRVEQAGGVDIAFNAIGIPQQGIQGMSLADLPADRFALPVVTYATSHFLTARAAVRRMVAKGSGVILMHTPEPGRSAAPRVGGMAPAWAAMEALSRNLSAEFASQGVRSVCLRTTGIPETGTIDVVFGLHGKAMGITGAEFQSIMESMSHTRRLTTLEQLANAAAFVASDQASGMTGAIVNVTGGKFTD